MKTLLIAFLLLTFSVPGVSQVQINLNVDANPSPRIADWINRDELALLTVTNTSPRLEGQPYKIMIRLSLDGEVVAETNVAGVPERRLVLGSEVLLADEVIPFEALRFYGNLERSVAQSGMLPAGTYNFCVSLLDLNGRVLSTPREVCRPMFITGYQLPEVIYPPAEFVVDGNSLQGMHFAWSPVSPAPPREMGVTYLVAVTEVEPGQRPAQALLVNYPLIEEEVMGFTRMMWPPDMEIPADSTQFVWGVKAMTMDGESYQKDNAGFSAVGTFMVKPALMLAKDMGENQEQEEGEKDGEEDKDKEGEPKDGGGPEPGEGTLASTDTIYAGENGEFMVIASNITEANGEFSGEGEVFVGWLNAPVSVSFSNITVDDDNHLVTGMITADIDDNAPVYPAQWAGQAAVNLVFTHQEVEAMKAWVENTPGQLLPYMNPNETFQPLQMPLGFNWINGSQLAISEMVFRADKSEFNAVAALALPYDMGTQLLGFLAKGIDFHPNNIDMPMERLELVDDFSIGNVNNQIVFQFNRPDGNNLGTYIEWDDDGFAEYGVQLTALFTRDWMIPSPDNDPAQKVSASLTVQGTDWNDLILGGTMDRAELVGTGGITILADSIYYDFSDLLNPPGIVFPENYPGDTSELFRGFYMKAFEIELPEAWQTQAGGAPTVSVQNMIINDTGLTMLAKGINVLQFPDADVADLVASIDTVHVEMVASSLVEAGVKGRVGLPVSKKDSIPNPLEYVALFNNPQLPNEPVSFQLTMSPTGPIPAHMLKGDLELAQTSSIVAYVDETKRTFDINLDGDFVWASVDLGPVKDVQLGLAFQGFGMTYDSSANNSFSLNIGSWAFASEQKFLANFPVTIQNVDFTTLPSQQNQLIRGKIGLDVIFNLSEDIGGMTGLAVELAIADNVQGQKFYPEYLGTSLDSIAIQANMAAVSIDGAIGFRNEDPVFGNGFIGTVNADIKPTGLQVSALAEFGNTSYQNGNQLYRYWRVEADVTLPPPGVVFLPGLAFRGFGGGAYYNMEAGLSGTAYTFTPLKSQLGFMAKASLATSPSEDGFNADAVLAGEFNMNTGGLTFINFTGDFWVGAEMNAQSRAQAIVSGDLGVTYNFPDKHFSLFANVDIDAPPVSTPAPVGLVLDVKGLENLWYFKLGEPSNLNTVSVFGANVYQYLMFGNDIPIPTGFTSQFSNAYHNAVNQYPGTGSLGSGGVGSHTDTGSGFALGIGFMFDHDDLFNVTGNYYVGFNLGAGAELHLAFLDYAGSCAGYNPIGINGWRASGGLGLYATASARVERIGGLLPDKEWSIASLAAGAWVYGEFPNPYYAAGAISGHAYVFDVVNVYFHREFEVGTICTNQPAGTSVTVTPGDVAADQQDKLIQYIQPVTTWNYPLDEPLAVKYGLEPGEVFDVAEQQADGTIKMRTFKLDKSAMLEMEETNGSWTVKMLNNTPNVLGEYLYTTIGQMQATQPAFGPAGPVMDTGGSEGGTGGMTLDLGMNGAILFDMVNGGGSGPTDSGNTGQVEEAKYPSLPYPVAPPSPSYGDLPPSPDPPENNLEADRQYRFTVTATLREYVNGSWVDAQTSYGEDVTETVVKNFSTGAMSVVGAQQNLQSF